jgi:hypothetical protein
MGANFDEITLSKMTEAKLKQAWQKIVEQCLYDYGHAGYTGTFAEKDGLEVIPGTWELDKARKHAEDNDKWGPAWAYRLQSGEWLIAGWCSD